MLGRWFDTLDALAERHCVYKLDTIGDAYLCASNVVIEQPDHAARMARFAIAAVAAATAMQVDPDAPELGSLAIRAGLNSGPCMATVIGRRNPKYTLFGDTINVASRMESTSVPGRVQCSSRTADLIHEQVHQAKLIIVNVI
jgi:class 3 adenylate cyclase